MSSKRNYAPVDNWWNKKVIGKITRNHIALVLAFAIIVVAMALGTDWNQAFGVR